MKLNELSPRWINSPAARTAPVARVGVTFLCPCCRNVRLTCYTQPTPQKQQFLLLAENGIIEVDEDGDPKRADIVPCNPAAKWSIEGDSFESLSIKPSIDASPSGHWHGYVTNGEAK